MVGVLPEGLEAKSDADTSPFRMPNAVFCFSTSFSSSLSSLMLAEQLLFIDSWVGWRDALAVTPWMFLVGMAIAGVSSFLSLRRYLKV